MRGPQGSSLRPAPNCPPALGKPLLPLFLRRGWPPALLVCGIFIGVLLCYAWTGGSSLLLPAVAPAGASLRLPCISDRGLPGPGAGKRRRAVQVKPSDWAGVRSYSIPGELELEPAFAGNDTGTRAGVLHIFLKALKWPVRRYRSCGTRSQVQQACLHDTHASTCSAQLSP